MRIRLRFGVTLDIDRTRDEPDEHEHRDLDSFVDLAGPQPIGFRVPTTGDDAR